MTAFGGARQFSELRYSTIYSVDFLSAFFSVIRDASDLSSTPSSVGFLSAFFLSSAIRAIRFLLFLLATVVFFSEFSDKSDLSSTLSSVDSSVDLWNFLGVQRQERSEFYSIFC